MSAKDRKGSRDKRKNNGGALAGTLFTAAMICCCVLIYLLSKGGRNTAKDTSMEIPPQPTAQMERVYPSVEVFFERAKGYGFDAEYTEDDGATWTGLPQGTIVSMNLWGFSPAYIDECVKRFPAFLDKNVPVNPLKCEFFLPTVVSELVEEGKADVRMLDNSDKWYGVTYKEDKEMVVEAFRRLKAEGVYPDNF